MIQGLAARANLAEAARTARQINTNAKLNKILNSPPKFDKPLIVFPEPRGLNSLDQKGDAFVKKIINATPISKESGSIFDNGDKKILDKFLKKPINPDKNIKKIIKEIKTPNKLSANDDAPLAKTGGLKEVVSKNWQEILQPKPQPKQTAAWWVQA